MAQSEPLFYNATDTSVVTSVTFPDLTPGTPTDATELHLWNQKDGTTADPLRRLRVAVAARLPGETLFAMAGTRWLDERWLQARVVGGSGEAVVVLTDWQDLGAGAALRLEDLPVDSAHHIEFRVYPTMPAAADFPVLPAGLEFLFQPLDAPTFALGLGHSEYSPDGVLSGLGDLAYSGLLYGSDVEENDTPDDTVKVGASGWISRGTPLAEGADTLALDDEDSEADALASGEEYWALVAWTAAGTAATKGAKAAAGAAELPAIPAGNIPRAYVLRNFDATINGSDIVNVWPERLARYGIIATSGLIVSLGAGEAGVDNSLVRHTTVQNVTLTASEVNTIWMTRGGALALTLSGAAPPNGRPLALYEFTTDGSGVTAMLDLRIFIGPRSARKTFRFGATLAPGSASPPEYAETNRDLLLDPEFAAALALDDLGAGNSSGETRVDIQYDPDGSGWVSIFPDDQSMLRVAYNATNPTARACRPTTCVIPAGSRLRAVVDGIPSGGTAPSGATGILMGWER